MGIMAPGIKAPGITAGLRGEAEAMVGMVEEGGRLLVLAQRRIAGLERQLSEISDALARAAAEQEEADSRRGLQKQERPSQPIDVETDALTRDTAEQLLALVGGIVVYDAVSVEGEFADADGAQRTDTGVVAVGAASRRGSHDGMGRFSEPREVGEES